ncbi:hypothetical protein [Roseofilum casamattae]|uniref:Uncharacterized protein n=1 Tax=Roseofilum casamattae BLCC-M143 TaxID=3022442 RepID=A0ABT7C3Z3_9CYAN|nr:hypothetical protein [Roseofilum casamattae]MDJ1185932.1 hypothetical protein [Roseofilum casamattae BLCC-M143]
MSAKWTALLLAVVMMELASAFTVLVGEPSVALVSYTNLVNDNEDEDEPLVPTNLQVEFTKRQKEEKDDDPIVPTNLQLELVDSQLEKMG